MSPSTTWSPARSASWIVPSHRLHLKPSATSDESHVHHCTTCESTLYIVCTEQSLPALPSHRHYKKTSDICTYCGASPQDVRHLFACNAHPSHQRIYGGIRWDQFVRLTTSTTGTLTDLTADQVVANNNRHYKATLQSLHHLPTTATNHYFRLSCIHLQSFVKKASCSIAGAISTK